MKKIDPNSLQSRIVDAINNSEVKPVSLHDIATKLNVSYSDVSKRIAGLYKSGRIRRSDVLKHGKKQDDNKTTSTNEKGIGIEGFRKLFDKSITIPNKIQFKIDSYLKEKGWEYDDTFRMVCEITLQDWRRYRDKFSRLQVKVDGKVIWGHPDLIDEMREVLLR